MMQPRLTVILLIVALCIGFTGSVLLAQQPEETEIPAPFDCSPQGMEDLSSMIEDYYFLDQTTADAGSLADSMYQRGLAYQLLAVECGHIQTSEASLTTSKTLLELANELQSLRALQVGSDPVAALVQIEDLTGDPLRGERLYNVEERTALNKLVACAACHAGATAAPATEDLWDSEALQQPEFADYTAELYIVESILQPHVYLVRGYSEVMPPDYGDIMAAQDLADIVAYLQVASISYTGPDSMDAIGAREKGSAEPDPRKSK